MEVPASAAPLFVRIHSCVCVCFCSMADEGLSMPLSFRSTLRRLYGRRPKLREPDAQSEGELKPIGTWSPSLCASGSHVAMPAQPSAQVRITLPQFPSFIAWKPFSKS